MNRRYRKTIIAGNWKMNNTLSQTKAFAEEIKPIISLAELVRTQAIPAKEKAHETSKAASQKAVNRDGRSLRLCDEDKAMLADSCKDETLKKKLNSLSEKFRYSDPVSCDELKELEERLRTEVSELEALANTDTAKATELVYTIALHLADRNRRCKELKH